MSPLPKRWRVFDQIGSTNDSIHAAAAAGEPEGTVHVAHEQIGGRGRLGRTWWSPPGSGLWMSVLLRPKIPAENAAGLSLLAGLAVKNGLRELLPRSISLYWPNDVYADSSRKLGGVLCEIRGTGTPDYWISCGVGLNIDLRSADIPLELRGRIADLAELGCEERNPIALGSRIVEAFWPLYERFQSGVALPDLVTAADLAHVGERVRVDRSSGGGETLRGVVAGLGKRGELLVRDRSGKIHEVLAGDVTYEEASGRD